MCAATAPGSTPWFFHGGNAGFHSSAGNTVTGGEAVAKRYLKDAAAFRDNGVGRFDIPQKGHSGEFGFWAGFQVAEVQIGDVPKPVEMRSRITEIFRRIDGDWKMIHRHADAPK
jgi:ketosteroid isomerase-like protein